MRVLRSDMTVLLGTGDGTDADRTVEHHPTLAGARARRHYD
jgi:hypothetical protein